MSTPETATFYREPFHKGLRDLGYQEGTNITLIVRYAEGKTERIPELVDELIAEKVDVMFLIRAAIPIARNARRLSLLFVPDSTTRSLKGLLPH